MLENSVNKINLEDFKKEFSLVLSGGSALGYSHLGTLKYLEENNLIPSEIVGTSMGALIAAAFAMGMSSNNIAIIVKNINYLKLIDFKILNTTLTGHAKIKSFLKNIFGNKMIGDLNIDLKITASSFKTGELVIFDKNSNIRIIDAICASISIPGVFELYKYKNHYYADGLLSSNLPIEASSKNIKNIIAVNVVNFHHLKNKIKDNNVIDILNRSFMICKINQGFDKLNLLHNSKTLILIEPNLSQYNFASFKHWKEISLIGYKETKMFLENNLK
ncbi:MAG: patatin-like phospholipase family protein [Nanoarchaeota archaeon]|nr:patatin-like phospholipase family protein [Nanoarchaeota archaeon]MCA9496527.1 patatin-like phospholipase family protein [Nanoarchaeota archaeon]